MPATLGSVTTFEVQSGNISWYLKQFYATAIANQLNNEVLALQLFEKVKLSWTGKHVIVPIRLGRNSGVGYAGEGNTIVTGGNQVGDKLTVEAKFLYGRLRISGPAMAAAEKGGTGAFVDSLDDEMKGIVDDVRNQANQSVFSGGRVVGFLNQHSASAAQVSGEAQRYWEFSGDTVKATRLENDATGSGAVVDIYRLDTMTVVSRQILSSSTRGTVQLGPVLDTTIVTGGFGLSVELVDAQANLSGSLSEEPSGIFDNLFRSSLWNVDKTTDANAGGSGRQGGFKGVCLTQATSGDHDRASLSIDRMEAVLDQIQERSGKVPDVILMHPIMRQEYFNLAVGGGATNLNVTTDGSQKKLDVASFQDLSYNGIKIQLSRHCPKGLLVFLTTDTWKLAELKTGGFAEETGALLTQVSNQDNYDAIYKWYFNIYCSQPNANGVLCGISYEGAAAVTTGVLP